MTRLRSVQRTAFGIALLSASLGFAVTATAEIVPCGADTCPVAFSIFVDGAGTETGGGQFLYDAKTGDISLDTSAESIRTTDSRLRCRP